MGRQVSLEWEGAGGRVSPAGDPSATPKVGDSPCEGTIGDGWGSDGWGSGAALPGDYVRLHVLNVPRGKAESIRAGLALGGPIVVSSMLRNENLRGVVHARVQRHTAIPNDVIVEVSL